MADKSNKSKMSKPPKGYKKETVLKAIKGTGGIMSTIAKRLQCDWTTADRAVKYWEDTIRAFDDEKEAILDLCESTLINAINNNQVDAAKWYLTKKGKQRGYADRLELTVEDSGPLEFLVVDPDADTDK